MRTTPGFGQLPTFSVTIDIAETLCGNEVYHIMDEFVECSAILHRHTLCGVPMEIVIESGRRKSIFGIHPL